MKKLVIGICVIVLAAVAAVVAIRSGSGAPDAVNDDADEKKPRRPMLVQSRGGLQRQKDAESAVRARDSRRRRLRAMLASRTAIPHPNGNKQIFLAIGKMGGDADFDGIYRDDEGVAFPKADQEICRKLEDAFEKEDLEELSALSEVAVNSKTKEVRENMLRSLSWFGSRSLVEMTPFLSDPDPEIAEMAHEEWLDAIQEIEEDSVRAQVIEMALLTLADQEMLADVAGELVGMDDLVAIQTIVNVLDAGGASVPHVKSTYEDITGDEWAGIDAAEAWLQENYDSGDDDAGTATQAEGAEMAPPPAQ